MRDKRHWRDKQDWELTTEERIERAGWFHGSHEDWQALSFTERGNLAFEATGCEVAYCTWEAPVDCVHTGCQVRRGEIKPMIALNRQLRAEMESGWLRFSIGSREGRTNVARLIRAARKAASETGVYDVWKIPGAGLGMVHVGIAS